MRVISNRTLHEFAEAYAGAKTSLQRWRERMESRTFHSLSALQGVFPSVARMGDDTVFAMQASSYRIVTRINHRRQLCYVKAVLPPLQARPFDEAARRYAREPLSYFGARFAHLANARLVATPSEHRFALLAIDRLVSEGAMTNEAHPQHASFGHLFDAVHVYEQIHLPF